MPEINPTKIVNKAAQTVQDHQSQQKFTLDNTISGALSGLTSGNPYGAAIGGAIGLASDIFKNVRNKKQTEKANQIARENATIDFNRQRSLLHESMDYNSEQAQLARMEKAGLNPALAYGQLSASTVSTPSSSQASTLDYKPSEVSSDANMLQLLQLLLNNRSAAANIDNTNADTAGKKIDNSYKSAVTEGNLLEQVERIAKLKADAHLSESQKKQIDDTLDAILQKYKSEINLNNSKASEADANSTYISGAKTNESNASANDHNASASYTSGARTEESKQNARTGKQQEKKLQYEAYDALLEYGYKKDDLKTLSIWMGEHGYPPAFASYVHEAIKNCASQTGKTVPTVIGNIIESWTSATSWLPFLSSEHRNDVLSMMQGVTTSEGSVVTTNNNSSNDRDSHGKPYNIDQQDRINESSKLLNELSPNEKELVNKYKKTHSPLETADYIIKLYFDNSRTRK